MTQAHRHLKILYIDCKEIPLRYSKMYYDNQNLNYSNVAHVPNIHINNFF